jgi:hypothetical protein
MSEEAGSNVEMSSEPMSTEIGSGEVESEVIEDSGLAQEADGAAVDELASDIEAAVDEGATDAEIQELIETFKIKVNGEERDVTLDWNNKEDIIRRLQLGESGQSAMQKASEMERNFEGELQNIINDPWKALEELGFDVDALAEERIQHQIQELKKSPEQIAHEKRDLELETLRQKLKKQEEDQEASRFDKLQQDAEFDLENQISDALSATSELPKSPYVVKRIADAMLVAMDNGRDDVTVQDVVPWVQKEINEELQGLFGSMPDKVLEQYIGNKTIDRLRQGRLTKMKTQTAKNIQDTGKQAPEEKKEEKKIKLNNWLKHGSSLSDF